jgi:spermidine synthase
MQFRAADKSRLPTSYYGPASGIGLAILRNPQRSGPEGARALRIGGVGLGAGTIAAYGEPGDLIRFYEINPEVIRIATSGTYFTYLKDCQAQVEVIPGDARLSMERELDRGEPQKFDVLAIDAFSGDAIPVHLLTEEAFQIYLKHLSGPQAIIAIHITNTYLDLRPVVLKLANRFGLRSAWINSYGNGETVSTSSWMLLSQSNPLVAGMADTLDGVRLPESRLWTDDYSNLFQVLRR